MMVGGVVLRACGPILSALLLILSFPRFDLDLLAWIALVPLLLALKGQSGRSSFGLSFITGFGFFCGVCSWLTRLEQVSWMEYIGLGVYLASYVGLFGLGLTLFTRHTRYPVPLTAPILWVSIEYLRAHALFLGVPVALIGHSQYQNLPIIQVASIGGVYGVSFLIVLVNALLTETFLRGGELVRPVPGWNSALLRAGLPLLLACFIPGLAWMYGSARLDQEMPAGHLTVAVIQANIPQALKWDPALMPQHLETHIRLTREAVRDGPVSLVVWPEASLPGPLHEDLRLQHTLAMLTQEARVPLLVGSASRPKFGGREFRAAHWLNSAQLISPSGLVTAHYDKIRLLPFAEYLPYRDVLPWPARFASQAGHFIPGHSYTIFPLGGSHFAVLICWETFFPELVRASVQSGTRFIVNMGNEAWFGETAVPYQFLAMNVFRAVENGIPIVRSMNTGISCLIDPHGRVVRRVEQHGKDLFVQGTLIGTVPSAQARTFYTNYGDVFAFSLMIALGLLWASLVWQARKRNPVRCFTSAWSLHS